jgi:hypothetical protein
MSKNKSISDLITEIQQENESLKGLAKLANQYCRQEFGYNVKELHQIIEKLNTYEQKQTDSSDPRAGQHLNLSYGE